MPESLYIHIPFCKGKCIYCSFFSGFPPEEELVSKYIDSLLKEIEVYSTMFDMKELKTIYIGGGTPSLLSERDIERIFGLIHKLDPKNLFEVTIEVNPEDITMEKARLYRNVGISRVSLGFQSMNDEILKLLGRRNTKTSNYRAFEILRKAGFDNISIDWIASITENDAENIVKDILYFESEHNSVYFLTVEEGTILARLINEGKFKVKSEEQYRKDYSFIREVLCRSNYQQYEVSNFARDERFFSKHNINYWNYGSYIGTGMGAVGFVYEKGENFSGKRWFNVRDFNSYFELTKQGKSSVENEEKIDLINGVKEFVMLGLRKTEGFYFKDFEKIFSIKFTDCFIMDKILSMRNYLKVTDEGISLKKRYVFVMNEIIRKIWDALLIKV